MGRAKATGPAGWCVGVGERGGGPRLGGKTGDGPKFKKNFFSNFN
jgi:hypothetical protein